MENLTLEELFVEAAESESWDLLELLLIKLREAEDISTGDIPSSIEFLLDSWADSIENSEARCRFCIALAELSPPDTAQFQNLLKASMKSLLPPYLIKTGHIRALGLRDSEVSLAETAHRFKTLSKLKTGVIVFLMETKKWGKVAGIDEFSSQVAVSSLNSGSSYAVPLAKALSTFVIFEPGPITRRVAEPTKRNITSSPVYTELLLKRALTDISPDEMKEITQSTLVPGLMSVAEFDEWWTDNPLDTPSSTPDDSGKRSPAEARSVHELHVLLSDLSENEKFGKDDAEKLAAFFEKMNRKTTLKDNIHLAETISMLSLHFSDDDLRIIFEPLRAKCVFWPADPDDISLENFETWGNLGAKTHLPNLVNVTEMLFGADYLAEIAAHLPLKSLNVVCAALDDELISKAVLYSEHLSCDILLWAWKNRAKHSEKLISVLNMDNVVQTVSTYDLPKAWGNAQRELKKLLIDNEQFQKTLIKNAKENAASIINALHKAKGIQQGEQQSLLIKLSRHSAELKDILSKGVGEKMLAAAASPHEESLSNVDIQQPLVTSQRSFDMLKKELDDIIKIHIPENREAIKVARAHGDFRENAEYDAAKERRNFLTNRRNELESDMLNIQTIDFYMIKPEEKVIIGSSVVVGDETYHLVGAWDGDPDKNMISYKTRLGEILQGKKAGDSLTMPDGSERTVKEVLPLPDNVLSILANEK